MSRLFVLLSSLLCANVWADLTVNGQNSPGASGGVDQYTLYLKDDQMRIDQLEGPDGEVKTSMIIRFEGSPAGTLFLDHQAKTVSIVPVETALAAEKMVSAQPDAASIAQPVTERNETKEVMGHTTEGYDFNFSGSAKPPGMNGQQMPPGMADRLKIRLNVSGTAWVAPGLDGADELAAFYAKMAENQMTFGGVNSERPSSDRDESLTYPGISYGLTNVMAEIAAKGLPLRTDMTTDVSVDAEGPMAGMMRQMMSGVAMNSSHTSEVTAVSTAAVDAELFYGGGLPDGYTQDLIDAPTGGR